jgi:CheY-like chemotaxis protein
VAVVSSYTLNFIKPFLQVELARLGVRSELYFGGFGQLESLLADPSSSLYEFAPDVVLLDIGMHGVDGYETCRRIRNDFGDQLVVVALTGFGQAQDKEKAARAGFSAHLTKPANPAELAHILRQRGRSTA